MTVSKQENVKWVDVSILHNQQISQFILIKRSQGLRGLASILVVVTHLARAFDTDLFAPNPGSDLSPRFLQLPLVRVLIQGRIGVAVFSLVTGYVCALKPIRLSRAGKYEDALVAVAKSAFRRVPRLMLPTTIITVIIWLLCQFGAFEIARASDSIWLQQTSPGLVPYFGDALYDLGHSCMTTWVNAQNTYDPNQWTLQPLLKGSMLVYIMIFATIYVVPKYRMMLCMAMYVYYFFSGECKFQPRKYNHTFLTDSLIYSSAVFGMQFFFGFFMADLQNLNPVSPTAPLALDTPDRPILLHRIYTSIRAPMLLLLGLYLASYPEIYAERAGWSSKLQYFSTFFLRDNADKPRYFTAFGLELIVLSIHCSPRTREILSNRLFLWLGKNSFAVYLLHGTLLRTALTYVLYGVQMPTLEVENEDGSFSDVKLTIENPLKMIFWFPVFFVVLYAIANFWTGKVDPLCAEWSRAIERWVFKGPEGVVETAQERRLSGGQTKRDDTVGEVGAEHEKRALISLGDIV